MANTVILEKGQRLTTQDKVRFKIPESDTITASGRRNMYSNYLFEDVELETMNSLEQTVGQIPVFPYAANSLACSSSQSTYSNTASV